jgi:starvation-inducible outer membrane lipoprotein
MYNDYPYDAEKIVPGVWMTWTVVPKVETENQYRSWLFPGRGRPKSWKYDERRMQGVRLRN